MRTKHTLASHLIYPLTARGARGVSPGNSETISSPRFRPFELAAASSGGNDFLRHDGSFSSTAPARPTPPPLLRVPSSASSSASSAHRPALLSLVIEKIGGGSVYEGIARAPLIFQFRFPRANSRPLISHSLPAAEVFRARRIARDRTTDVTSGTLYDTSARRELAQETLRNSAKCRHESLPSEREERREAAKLRVTGGRGREIKKRERKKREGRTQWPIVRAHSNILSLVSSVCRDRHPASYDSATLK